MTFNVYSGSGYPAYGSTSTGSYNRFMGNDSPLGYNVPSQSIRGPSGFGSINTGRGNSPTDRQNRVDAMVNQAMERFDAQTQIRQNIYNQQVQDFADTTGNLRNQFAQSQLGPELNRQSYGGNSYTGDAYQKFMGTQGVGGVLGGTNSTPSQRYRDWNNQINNRQAQAFQTLSPYWARYGMNPTPYGPQPFRM